MAHYHYDRPGSVKQPSHVLTERFHGVGGNVTVETGTQIAEGNRDLICLGPKMEGKKKNPTLSSITNVAKLLVVWSYLLMHISVAAKSKYYHYFCLGGRKQLTVL